MRNAFGLSLGMIGCLSIAVLAQEVPQPKNRPGAQVGRPGAAPPGERAPADRAPGAADRGNMAQGDQQIAAVVYLGCRNHIEIATFAQDRLQNPAAKQFAEKMISDHTPGCEKMKELAGNLVAAGDREPEARGEVPGAAPPARRGETRPDRGARNDAGADTPAEERREAREERREERREAVRDAAKTGVEVEVQPGQRPGVAVRTGQPWAAGQLNWIAIHQEVADQCLNTVKRELGSKKGAEFDQCYMGHEVMVHLMTIDELNVLKKHASPALRADLDKSLQLAQGHLREAKQIIEDLKGEGGNEPRLSRAPGEAAPRATPATPKTKRD